MDIDDDANQRYKVESKSAFDGRISSHRIDLCNIKQSTRVDVDKVRAILDETRSTIANKLEEALNEHYTIEATLNLEGSHDEYDYNPLKFQTTKLLNSTDSQLNIQKYLDTAKEKLICHFNDYDSNNQGTMHFHYLRLFIHKVDTEDCIVDVLSNDNTSFKWSILAALHPGKETPDELHRFSSDLVMDDIDNPVQLDDIPRIEKKNKFSINVYVVKKSSVSITQNVIEGPVYHTKKRQKLHINLLLRLENGKRRYSYIKGLNSSIEKQFCDGCLHFFDEKVKFDQHQREECLKMKTTFPTKENEKRVKFSNLKYTEKLPFIVYAHFVTLEVKIPDSTDELNEKQSNNVWIAHTHKHMPYSYGYYIKCNCDCGNDDFSMTRINCGDQDLHECVSSFTDNLVNDLRRKWSDYKNKHSKASIKHVPVILKNLGTNGTYLIKDKKYDSILLRFEKIFAVQKKLDLGDGANSVYIRFLDFSEFIKDPLKDVVETIKEDRGFNDMRELAQGREDIEMLTEKKLIFPHKDVNESLDNLLKSSLPDHDEYNDAREVWRYYRCTNIGQYLGVYIKSNIFVIASVIENLRNFCMTHYELDPAHYFSIAAFSWDAMLKKTEVELELFADIEMINFIKKGIRGGFVQCNKRYAKANNRYLQEYFNKELEQSYIMYLDATNLGGYAMSQPLPYGVYEWVDVNVDYKTLNSDFGYILEVDLSYPVELHDKHSDLPFCPIKRNVYGAKKEFLVADFHRKTRYVIHHSYLALCVKEGLRIDKIHRVLKFKQRPWLKSYIDFNTTMRQEARNKCDKNFFKLLNNCIQGKFIVNLDNSDSNKLLHHYENKGCMEGAYSSINRPDCCSYTICSESAVAVQIMNTNMCFKTPIIAGFCISDLIKTHMYKFHYQFMKKEVGDKLCLLYTDNDSLIYEFLNFDIYEFIKEIFSSTELLAELKALGTGFDTSGYDIDNIFKIPQKFGKIGYFKDELKGSIVKEFVGLKPKVYAITYKNETGTLTTKTKAINVPENVRNTFHIDSYKDRIFNNEPLYKIYTRTRAVDHDVYTQDVKRMVLSPNDRKRCILPDKVNSLPWGHYDIIKRQNTNIS